MIASYNWWKIHTSDTAWMSRWHYANTTLLWKYYEYVSTNVFKIAM